MVRQVVRSWQGRVGLGLSGLIVIAVVAAVAVYIFAPGPRGSGGSGKTPTPAPTLAATGDSVVFSIDTSASSASFTIDEIHFGQPNTVVGKTNQVTGQILVNTKNPAQSQIGQIRVDLSTMLTDNDLRNDALRNRIFETSDPANQFAVFAAKSLAGLPTSTAGHAIGDTITFTVTGDLTVHQVTKSVTFEITLTVRSATRIEGHAQTTVRYQDFNLVIPNVPSVTGVADTVTLALDFVAKA